jgi:hypothetical protein
MSAAGTRGALSFLHHPFLHACIIALACALAYATSFSVPFQFDDSHAIVDNAAIRDISSIPSLFWKAEGSIGTRPLTLATFAVNYALGGLDPFGYHLFNLLVHSGNALLLFLLIRRTGRLLRRNDAGIPALLAALLFALHPLHTQSVTYVVSRSMPLAGFFTLTGLLLFSRASARGKTSSRATGALVLVSLCGMASREDFIAFPFLLLLYDYLFVARGRFRETAGRWKIHLPVFLTSLYLVFLLANLEPQTTRGYGIEAVTAREYLLTQFRIHWTYLRLLFLPVNLHLDYDYPYAASLSEPATAASLAGYLVLWGLAIGLMRRNPIVSFSLLWFLACLLPPSVYPVADVMFEHRVYLASLGPLTLAAVALWRLRPT